MFQQLAAGFVAAVLLATPAMGQEAGDTTYRSKSVPVWVMVKDHEEDAGAHEVLVAVAWDPQGTPMPFAEKLSEGDLVVLVPRKEDAEEKDLADGCRFVNTAMEHGLSKLKGTKRMDDTCTAPEAKTLPLLGVEYIGGSMTCVVATRKDATSDPAIRYFGCHWTKPPEG